VNPDVDGYTRDGRTVIFAIQIQSWIFKTQPMSNRSPKSLRNSKSKSK